MCEVVLFERHKTFATPASSNPPSTKLYTQTQTKTALSPYDDDKRYVLEDCIHTPTYCHYKIPKPTLLVGRIFDIQM